VEKKLLPTGGQKLAGNLPQADGVPVVAIDTAPGYHASEGFMTAEAVTFQSFMAFEQRSGTHRKIRKGDEQGDKQGEKSEEDTQKPHTVTSS